MTDRGAPGTDVPADHTTTPTAERSRRGRYTELDGLRGLGAGVVVLYHLMLVVPALSVLYDIGTTGGTTTELFSAEWWLVQTPLRLAWGGHEAVLVFFVLSGFVLTLPLLPTRGAADGWLSYYVRRLSRLCLPVVASLIFAYLLAVLVPRDPSFGSTWLASHVAPTLGQTAKDAWLLAGTSNLNSPLWSLRWEVFFSLLLPVMFWLMLTGRLRRWWAPAILLMCVTSALAQLPVMKQLLPQAWITVGLMEYLPVFAIGMILCENFEAVQHRLHSACERRPVLSHVLFAVGAVVLAACPKYVIGNVPIGVKVTLDALSLLGVVLIVLLAMESPLFGGFLNSRPMQWAGTRSFSIYLVHEPIVVALALATRSDSAWPWAAWAAVAVCLSLLAAEVFYRLVERPTHLLSRRLGRWTARPRRPSVPAAG